MSKLEENSEIKKEDLKELESEVNTSDRDELLSKTEERLDQVLSGKNLSDLPAESDGASKSTPDKDNDPADEEDDLDEPTPAEKEAEEQLLKDQKQAKESEGDKEDTAGDEKTITPLSDAYYRAAKHMGWTDEDIEKFHSSDPEMAAKTFAKILESVNRSSREFAALGRSLKEKNQQDTTRTEQARPEQTKKTEFKGIDIEKLRQDYPGDSIVDMVDAMQKQNELLFNQVQELVSRPAPETAQPASGQDAGMAQEVAAVQKQVKMFFTGDDMKLYDDFYGSEPSDAKDWNHLTPGQKANRWAVLEMADQLVEGASAYGQEMDLNEALYRAHLSVSEPIREKVIRKDIQSKIEKRSKGLTIKPSGTKSDEGEGKPSNRNELVSTVSSRLSKLSW